MGRTKPSPTEWKLFAAARALVTNHAMLPALLLAIAALWLSHSRQANSPGADFFHYWITPQAVSGHWCQNIYTQEGRRAISKRSMEVAQASGNKQLQAAAQAVYEASDKEVDTTGTPLIYSVFGLFSSGDYSRDLNRYSLLCMMCLGGSIIALCLRFGWPLASSLIMLSLTGLVLSPVLSDVYVANVNQVQLALLAAFLILQAAPEARIRGLGAGFVLGISVLLKPNFAFIAVTVALVWLVDRQYRKLLWTMAGAIGGILVGMLIIHSVFDSLDCLWAWSRALPRLLSDHYSVESGNVSLARVIRESAGVEISSLLAAALFAGLGVAAWAGRKPRGRSYDSRDFDRTALAVGAGACVGLLATPLAWLHYYLLAIPLVVFFLRPVVQWDMLAMVRRLFAILCLITFSTLCDSCEPLTRAILMDVGVLALVAFALWELASRGQEGVRIA